MGSTHATLIQSRPGGLAGALAVLVTAFLTVSVAACGSDQLTGSWRADGEKGGRRLIIAKQGDGYRMAFPGTGGWLVLEPQGDAQVATVRVSDPRNDLPFESERFTVRFDEDLHKLVLSDEQLDADGKVLFGFDVTFTKVSDNTEGPPWSE